MKVQFSLLSSPVQNPSLQLCAVEGREAISQGYRYQLTLDSQGVDLVAEQWLGQPIALVVRCGESHYVNGIVTEFKQLINLNSRYQLVVAPELWRLKLNVHCRVFADQSIVEVIEYLVKDLRFMKINLAKLKNHYPKKNFYQYQQSNYEFWQWILAEAGINYYFVQSESAHELILTDCAFSDFYPPILAHSSQSDEGCLLVMHHKIQHCEKTITLSDYNFKTSQLELQLNEKVAEFNNSAGALGELTKEIYPGGFTSSAEGAIKLKQAVTARQAQIDYYQLSSGYLGLRPGLLIQVQGHAVPYLITEITHNANDYSAQTLQETNLRGYENHFKVIDRINFQPIQPVRPLIANAQQAIVVGQCNEINEWAEIKVKLEWDENHSPIWARLAQMWAGNQCGAWFVPRINDRVVVCFLDGLPERPLVLGMIAQNELNLMPNDFSIKTTAKQNPQASDFNELSLFESSQQPYCYWHAAHDFDLQVAGKAQLESANAVYQMHSGNFKADIKQTHKVTAAKSIKVIVGSSSLLLFPDKIILSSPDIEIN